MNLILRCLLLAMLTLTATVGRAMPCPMTAGMSTRAPASQPVHHPITAGEQTPCDSQTRLDDVATGAHVLMSLSDCLADLPPLPQQFLALATPADDAVIPAAAWPQPEPATPASSPLRQPQPPPLALTATSAHWSSTQRLLL